MEAGKWLEAFSIELVILAIWKQALHICHTQAASAMDGSPNPENTRSRRSTKKHGSPDSEECLDGNTKGPRDILSQIESEFLREFEHAEELAKAVEPGNIEMPDAMETIFQSALAFGRHGGGAILVNIARGGLIDYEAVAHHIESGHLGGLGIDVAWTEPFEPGDPILKLKNVIITPHVAGVTEHSYRSMAKVVGDVALQLHAGLPLFGIEFVN